MEDADFGARLRHIRNDILNTTLEKLGEELGIGKSQLSNVESGKSKLGTAPLLKLIENHKDIFDVRYLFGQLDNPDLADLRKTGGVATTDNVLKKINELTLLVVSKVANAPNELTKEAERVEIDLVLRGLVRKIMNLRRPLWEKVDAYISGVSSIFATEDSDLGDEKERAVAQ